MSFRDPDVEIHATGWVAIAVVAYIVITAAETLFDFISKVASLLT